jgi:hypothetical protein
MDRFVAVEFDDAVAFGEKGEIIAAAHEAARTKTVAALADDNAPGRHKLAAVSLDPEPLGL